MKEIELTKGYKTIVDDDDFDYLNQLSFCVTFSNNKPYAKTTIRVGGKGKNLFMHRLINKTPLGLYTDHINRNTLDNRKCNLRTVTAKQNAINRGCHRDSQVQYKGVFLSKKKKKYVAQIKHNGILLYLGTYDTPKEAAKVYDENAIKYFGEFAYLNFPLDNQKK